MCQYNYANELYHHGILGMKWGVRRTPEQLARARGSTKKSSIDDDISKMSDAELRSKINRMSMEQQYKKLSSTKKVSAGKKFVAGVLVASATAVATKYTTKYMDKGATYVAGKIASKVVKK